MSINKRKQGILAILMCFMLILSVIFPLIPKLNDVHAEPLSQCTACPIPIKGYIDENGSLQYGFTHDLILAHGQTNLQVTPIQADIDGDRQWFYEAGYNNISTGGIPYQITSVSTPYITYNLANFNEKNGFLLGYNGTNAVTIEFADEKQQPYEQIAILATSANGNAYTNVTFVFDDNTTSEPISITVNDWWNGQVFAIKGVNRLNNDNFPYGGTENARLYDHIIDIPEEHIDKSLKKLTINFSGSSDSSTRTGIFAISGVPSTNEPSTPSYTVSYDGNGHTGGTVPNDNNNYQEGESVTVIGNSGNLVKTGYSFSGWSTQPDDNGTNYSEGSTFNITENITLYAKWNLNTYTVTFRDYDDSIIDIVTVQHGSNAIPPVDPTREGHSFVSWDTPFSNVTSDLIVTALYSVNQYTISFDSNGGSVVDPISADFGTSIPAPTNPARLGYVFVGWYSNSNLQNAWSFETNTIPAGNMTLYAKWIPKTTRIIGTSQNDQSNSIFIYRDNETGLIRVYFPGK